MADLLWLNATFRSCIGRFSDINNKITLDGLAMVQGLFIRYLANIYKIFFFH